MSRWEVKKKERDANIERSKTPYVAPVPEVQKGVDLRRGGGVRNREPFKLPDFLQPSVISTPARGATSGRGVRPTSKSTEQKPAAPAKPAVSRGRNLPPSAAVPGTGPDGNKVGSDADPNTPGLQGPGAPGARVNANGLLSYGKDLKSLNAFTSAFTGGYELTDIKSAFKSNTLPGAEDYGANRHQLQDTPYELAADATPSNVGGKYAMDGVDTSVTNTGYKIDGASVPGTVGGNTNDPQDGTSSKPDVAESIRQVRMARTEGSPRGFNGADFSGAEPDNSSLVSPMYKNARRNKIRSTFLDHEGNSVQAIAAANAVAGYGKDSDGRARVNYGGKLYNFKDGMEQKGRNALMEGRTEDAFQYLDGIGDTPAASELSIAPQSAVKPGTITAPENNGGSLETQAPITKPSPEKFQQAQDFLTNNMQMLNRRTK